MNPQAHMQYYLQYPRYENNLCPSMEEWIRKMWYIYNGILFSHEKGHSTFCNNMNGP